MSDIRYRCAVCDTRATAPQGNSAPLCCGQAMTAEPLPYCTTVPNSEMARPGNADGPCDDGTLSKKR